MKILSRRISELKKSGEVIDEEKVKKDFLRRIKRNKRKIKLAEEKRLRG